MSDDLKLASLADWQQLFDDKAYWQQSPDAHFTELMQVANDLFGRGAIDLARWQDLKNQAEQLHQRSPDANVAEEVADPDA
ncbi:MULTISPECIES: hypothetical protein [Pseudomonas]|jgi:hypothetical protein|uniref:Uncharacterized protein n=1 Tax=Pseudomonas beijingensis TaxID=2954101 RepID=A0ABY9FJC2_9PSED|nr:MULTISPECIES: hypothetical protein [unclassified Pseudomonas]WLH03228.1 hypothetical protein PSH92_10245 [Pseudomonas sp. FP2034]WLH48284.1 hypothetical protein PSH83_10295 [Pseudomonas sp. FP2262]WLI42991.1 hypothetical protein PSH84_15180 [Pseudomonas sp. FP830]